MRDDQTRSVANGHLLPFNAAMLSSVSQSERKVVTTTLRVCLCVEGGREGGRGIHALQPRLLFIRCFSETVLQHIFTECIATSEVSRAKETTTI